MISRCAIPLDAIQFTILNTKTPHGNRKKKNGTITSPRRLAQQQQHQYQYQYQQQPRFVTIAAKPQKRQRW